MHPFVLMTSIHACLSPKAAAFLRRRSLAVQRSSSDQLDLSGWTARQQVV